MPFTPFHMGPGMALKSVAGNRFSLITFGAAQVAMDIEPGVGMLRGAAVLHGWSHTYLGAAAIGAAVLLCRPACNWILHRWNAELRHHRLNWVVSPEPIAWLPAAVGAFAGTLSHVALDSLMHFDIRPSAPFSDANSLLGLISFRSVYLSCVAAGIAGLMLWVSAQWRRRDG